MGVVVTINVVNRIYVECYIAFSGFCQNLLLQPNHSLTNIKVYFENNKGFMVFFGNVTENRDSRDSRDSQDDLITDYGLRIRCQMPDNPIN